MNDTLLFLVLVPVALAAGSVGLLLAWRRDELRRRRTREYLSRI